MTEIFAKTIWGEARGEGEAGMNAVASVVMNRLAFADTLMRMFNQASWLGTTIDEICQKPKQFSCWNSNDPNFPIMSQPGPIADKIYPACQAVAATAAAGTLPDSTSNATHYYNIHTAKPKWAVGETALVTIGNHAFFRPKEIRAWDAKFNGQSRVAMMTAARVVRKPA